MKLIARVIGNLIFLVAFALSVKLAWELHANEIVPLGVAGLALVMSAFGLLFARNSWLEGSKPEWMLGVFMWIVGACAFTITEWGFWFSSYTERHAEYQEIKKTKTRTEGLKDQAWTALTTGQVPKTSAQIQADLDAKKLDPIYTRSIQCTDATMPDSRAFCADYFALKSEIASVKKRESLEQQVQAPEGPAEKTLIHDVFAQAEWLSKLLGVSEQTAATIIILGSWLVLMVCRDTGILIANPPKRPAPVVAQQPQEAPEPIPAVITAPVVEAAPQPPVTPPTGPKPGSRALGDMARLTTEDSAPDDAVTEPDNVVNLYEPPVNPRDEKRRKKEIIDRQNRALVSRYVDVRLDTGASSAEIVLTAKGGHLSGGTAGDDVYTDFRRWCRDEGETPVGRNHFGRFIGEFVDRARNSKGVVYGAVIRSAIKARKAA